MKIKEQRECKNIILFALMSEIIQRTINIKGKKTQIGQYVGRETNYREGMENIQQYYWIKTYNGKQGSKKKKSWGNNI